LHPGIREKPMPLENGQTDLVVLEHLIDDVTISLDPFTDALA
jgi:hypothetical protein